jgi:hypothetical protein
MSDFLIKEDYYHNYENSSRLIGLAPRRLSGGCRWRDQTGKQIVLYRILARLRTLALGNSVPRAFSSEVDTGSGSRKCDKTNFLFRGI